jgi:DNA-binding MarR family transcriptional regulator
VPDERVIGAVERLIVGGVAITARALGDEEADLTLMQWRVLVVVGDQAAGVHVGVVGQSLGTSSPSASRIIRRLEDRGLVELVRDEADRRFMLVRLTRSGRAVRANLMERRRSLIRAAFDGTDGTLPTDLADALDIIASALSSGA